MELAERAGMTQKKRITASISLTTETGIGETREQVDDDIKVQAGELIIIIKIIIARYAEAT